MNDFKKASEDTEADRVIDRNIKLLSASYKGIKEEVLGREPEGREIGMVSTLFIQTKRDLSSGGSKSVGKPDREASEKQKKFIKDLIEKGKISDKYKDELDNLTKQEASKLIKQGKRR